MIKIDDSLLEEIGLISLPKAERDQLLRQIYETLEMRVGMRLAERMSDQQLDEFERFIDTNDEAGALKWLETNFPDYKQVVASELDKLKGEIKQDSSKIIEAMQTNAVGISQPDAQPTTTSSATPGNFANTPPTQQPSQSPQAENHADQSFSQPVPPAVKPPAQPYQNIPPPPPSSYDEDQQRPIAA